MRELGNVQGQINVIAQNEQLDEKQQKNYANIALFWLFHGVS